MPDGLLFQSDLKVKSWKFEPDPVILRGACEGLEVWNFYEIQNVTEMKILKIKAYQKTMLHKNSHQFENNLAHNLCNNFNWIIIKLKIF